jgi:hypothetical protein
MCPCWGWAAGRWISSGTAPSSAPRTSRAPWSACCSPPPSSRWPPSSSSAVPPAPCFTARSGCGEKSRVFPLYKLRTMPVDAEQDSGPVWTAPDDPRRTAVGAFLRRYNLDELPQFWNVLKGDMSLVGPRPERPHFVEQFKEDINRYMSRHVSKPGMTGWAQVHGLRGQTDLRKRIEYDLWYLGELVALPGFQDPGPHLFLGARTRTESRRTTSCSPAAMRRAQTHSYRRALMGSQQGRLAGRPQTEHHTPPARRSRRPPPTVGAEMVTVHPRKLRHGQGRPHPQPDAEQTADRPHRHRLHQELGQDITAPRPHRLAQPRSRACARSH